jgi:E3 ubiquitin-protein ligase RAD18
MKKKCPACDAQISEASIRRNRALEDVTDAWDAARQVSMWLSSFALTERPAIMNFCTNALAGPSRRRPDPPSKPSSSNSVKRQRETSPTRSSSPSKVRKLDGDVLELLDSEDAQDADIGEEVLDENGGLRM